MARRYAGTGSAPVFQRAFTGLCALVLTSTAFAQQPANASHHELGHYGPGVEPGDTGPARWSQQFFNAFDLDRAMEDLRYADQWYRTPGGEGYNAALDRIASRLREIGFGQDPRLRLEILLNEMPYESWTPKSASLILRSGGDRPPVVLHAFSHPGDRDRTMLPRFAPSADVQGRPVFSLEEVEPGTVLVTAAKASSNLITRARRRGASALLSSALFGFTVDPTGDRHRDAILYAKVPGDTSLPVAQISPRTHDRIRQAVEGSADVSLALAVEVSRGTKQLRTLVAEVVGTTNPNETIVVASHVQEPGAGDNASGIAGLCESVCSLTKLLKAESAPWPKRTISFVWGDEMRQSSLFLDNTERIAIAGISADMLGQSQGETGAIALLERDKDPGALLTIEPDSHTPWGAGQVELEDLKPNGLALVARTAIADVAALEGHWTTAENPWEGGSDHDVFIKRGIPGILFWHFTDFTYHTSLDRVEMIDPLELRRSCVVVATIAFALAHPLEGDLERYLASNEIERRLRIDAAKDVEEEEIQAHWNEWCDGAARWLQAVCKI